MNLFLIRTLALINENDINVPRTQAGPAQITTILQIVFGIIGAVSVIVVALAGLSYVISNGDPQRAAKAKDTILYAVIGLVISIFSFAIVTFVLGKIF